MHIEGVKLIDSVERPSSSGRESKLVSDLAALAATPTTVRLQRISFLTPALDAIANSYGVEGLGLKMRRTSSNEIDMGQFLRFVSLGDGRDSGRPSFD
jgi:hypothetical protein